MEWYVSPPPTKRWKSPPAFFFIFSLMKKKIFVPLFFSSIWKSLVLRTNEMPVSYIPLDSYTPLFFKISGCREPMCMEINKSIVLETHPPRWECYKLTAQRRYGSPGSTKGKSHFLPMNILITTRILTLVTVIMALKGSELFSPQFKVSVTQSYYYIHYKTYHYRNTIYQSQISAWTNLGFHF